MKRYLSILLLLITGVSFGQGTGIGAPGATQHNRGGAVDDSMQKWPIRVPVPYAYYPDSTGQVFVGKTDTLPYYMKFGRNEIYRFLTTNDLITGGLNIATAGLKWTGNYLQNVNHKVIDFDSVKKVVITDDSGKSAFCIDTSFMTTHRGVIGLYHRHDTDIVGTGNFINNTGMLALHTTSVTQVDLSAGTSALEFYSDPTIVEFEIGLNGNQIIEADSDPGNTYTNVQVGVNSYYTQYNTTYDWVSTFVNGVLSLQLDRANAKYGIGDLGGAGNTTAMVCDDGSRLFVFTAGSGKMSVDVTNVANRHRTEPNTDGYYSIAATITTPAYGTTVNQAATILVNGATLDAEFHTGTGATGYLLPTGVNAEVGSIVKICDLDAIAVTSNITIDAGTGNTINATTVAQTKVMNVSGSCYTLKKVTSTAWKLQ